MWEEGRGGGGGKRLGLRKIKKLWVKFQNFIVRNIIQFKCLSSFLYYLHIQFKFQDIEGIAWKPFQGYFVLIIELGIAVASLRQCKCTNLGSRQLN